MEINYLKIEIVLQKNIGAIDKTKVNAVQEILKEKFPNVINLPPVGVAFASSDNISGTIFLAENQLSYQNQLPVQTGAGTINSAIELIDKIFEKLLLSQDGKYLINAEFIIKAKNGASETLTIDVDPINKEENNIIAKGIKYFIEDSEAVGLYTFEPYMKDNSYYFVSFNMQMKEDLLNFDDAAHKFRDYRDKFEKLTSEKIKGIKNV